MITNKVVIVGGSVGIIGHIDHGSTTVRNSIIDIDKHIKTIDEIMEEERGIKITRMYNNYIDESRFYDSVGEGKKRGTNFTPKKKKRKK